MDALRKVREPSPIISYYTEVLEDESISIEQMPNIPLVIHHLGAQRKTKAQLELEDFRAWVLLHELPRMSQKRAYGACAANVLIPGSGTIYAAYQSEDPQVKQTQIYVGLLQLLTTTQLVGYPWSVYWGILMVKKAREEQER